MSDDDRVFVGTYSGTEDAEAEYEVVKRLHSEGVIGAYDAAVVDNDDGGNVHVHLHEKPTQYGAWTGLVVGALVGILFPPSMLVADLAGAAMGGAVGAGAIQPIEPYWSGQQRCFMLDIRWNAS